MNIKERIINLTKDNFILHSIVVFLGTSLNGAFNLFYHLVSVRLLSPQDYGTFNAMISVVTLTSMAITPFGATLTRFFSEYIAKKDFDVFLFVLKKAMKQLFLVAMFVFILFTVFSPLIANFLHTRNLYVILAGGVIAVSIVSFTFPSVFQSFQKFKTYSFIISISSFLRFGSGALLMLLGFGVSGGLSGFLISYSVSFLISIFFIIPIIKRIKAEIGIEKKVLNVSLVPLYKFFIPVSVAMLSFTFFTSVDVVLVKHFLTSLEAGYYSMAQMVGKIILFAPSALAIVIFPKSVEAHTNKICSLKLLYKAIILAALFCFAMTAVSFFAPNLVLRILTGGSNPVSASLVGLFSLAMSFYALTMIVMNFLFAVNNLKFVPIFVFIAIAETVLIYTFHDTLKQVLSIVFVFSVASFLSSFFVAYFLRDKYHPKEEPICAL